METALNQNGDRFLNHRDILEPLVKANLLTSSEAGKHLKNWSAVKQHPLQHLSELEIFDPLEQARKLTSDGILLLLAHKWDLKYKRLDLLNVKLEAVAGLLPYAYIKRLNIAPIEITENKVVILTSEPFALSWKDEVKKQLKRNIDLQITTPAEIKHLLHEIYVLQNVFKDIADEQGEFGVQKLKLLKQGKVNELDLIIEQAKGKRLLTQDGHVSRMAEWLLNFASMERASDIHLEPKKGLAQIRFRVDGVLRTVYRMDHETMMMIIAHFKLLGSMRVDDKRKPQDAGMKKVLENGKKVEMRLSTLPTNFGEKMAIRIFDSNVIGKDLSYIGFYPEDRKLWEELIHTSQGLILVTGPTGSGKTTTLYTTLNKIASNEVNICTAEDPIEVEVESLNQVQVNTKIGFTFADCVRTFLRQDPDVIMIGEIRDQETGEMAIQSSLTGHLVFSTLHTNGALASLQRLVDLGLQTFLIKSSLIGILSQRLVKRLCPCCKRQVKTDPYMWEALLDGEFLNMPEFVYEAVGCPECKETGYHGRLCVYELVKVDEKIKNIIHQKIEFQELKQKSKGLFSSLRLNCAKKIFMGETCFEEIMKAVY